MFLCLRVSGCVVVSFRLGWLCKGLLVPSSPACGYSLCGRWVGEEGSFLGCLLLALVTSRLLVVVRVSLTPCPAGYFPALTRGVKWRLCTLPALLR